MDRLISVIGLAPSELPIEALVEKLRKERARSIKEVDDYIAANTKTGKLRGASPKKAQKARVDAATMVELTELAKQYGISPAALLAKLQAEANH